MAESFVNVTEGSGKKLHTFERTIGANSVHDEVVLAGEPYLASYVVPFISLSVATTGTQLVTIMAGSSLNVYIRRIAIWSHNPGGWTGAGPLVIQLVRLTTASSAGTAVTPSPLDPADAASGAVARTRPTAGTEGTLLHAIQVGSTKVTNDGMALATEVIFTMERTKSLKIAAGTTNGIALKLSNSDAAGSVNGFIEFTEANF